MRSLKQLYILLLEHINKQGVYFVICTELYKMHVNLKLISYDEYNLILMHFKSTKPVDGSIWTKHDSWRGKLGWWSMSEAGAEQRKLFIQQTINTL